jgi:hypothetical protein
MTGLFDAFCIVWFIDVGGSGDRNGEQFEDCALLLLLLFVLDDSFTVLFFDWKIDPLGDREDNGELRLLVVALFSGIHRFEVGVVVVVILFNRGSVGRWWWLVWDELTKELLLLPNIAFLIGLNGMSLGAGGAGSTNGEAFELFFKPESEHGEVPTESIPESHGEVAILKKEEGRTFDGE